MLINLRNRNIIDLIINNPQTIEQISSQINVSTRTIRRDFIKINHILNQYNYQIIKEGKHYKIDDPNNELHKILDQNSQVDFNNIEKSVIYLSQISQENNDINIQVISDEIYISIEKSKEEVRQTLLKYDLNFNYKKNKYTVEIKPEEKIIKFNEIILKYFSMFRLEEIIVSESIESLSINKVRKYLGKYFELDMFSNTFKTIEESFNQHQTYINDQELFNLTIKILIAIKQKVNLPKDNDVNNLMSSNLSEYIIKELNIKEKKLSNYITHEISSLVTEFEVEKIDYGRIGDIQKFITKFFENFNFTNINTHSLEYKILLHDKRTELNQNISISKEDITVIDDLIKSNLKIYKVLEKVNNILKLYSEEKLKYVFIYFIMEVENLILNNKYDILVICSGGVGSSLMVKKQIQRFLPNSNIQNVSLTRALNMDYKSKDLIISLTKLPNNIEDIVVSHVVSEEDFVKIKNKLIDKKTKSHVKTSFANFYMDKVDNTNLENNESLKTNLNNLEEKNLIEDAAYLYQKLKKREVLGIGVPTSKVAFYHTRSSSIKQGIIQIIKCQNFLILGLDMKEQQCNIILLVLLPAIVETEIIEKVNALSYELITNEKLLKSIEKSKLEKIKEIIQ